MNLDSNPDQQYHLFDQVPLDNIIEFLKEGWKTIVGSMLLGVAGATLSVFLLPKQYDVIAQIRMAQIAPSELIQNSMSKLYIEEPSELISRFELPSTYSDEMIVLCGLENQSDSKSVLAKKVKFSVPKGTGGLVNLNISGFSKDISYSCAKAIFVSIMSSQSELVTSYIDFVSTDLLTYKKRLKEINDQLATLDKSSPTFFVMFFMAQEEIRNLQSRISNLNYIILSADRYPTSLVAPIYIKEGRSHQKSIMIGLLLGCFLGLFLVFVRKLNRSKSNP